MNLIVCIKNHENNIELIKSKYIETGLKLFHNEKGRALGDGQERLKTLKNVFPYSFAYFFKFL